MLFHASAQSSTTLRIPQARWTEKRGSSFGFTLIELLIVIAIILILIAIALPNFLEAQIRAKITKAYAEMRTISIAMDTYFLDWRLYPPDHDPNDLGQKGFYQLTSPIPYLKGGIPIEPFAQRSGMIEAGGEIGWEMASTGEPPRYLMQGITVAGNIHAFAMISEGPDVDEDWHGNDSWPFCAGNVSNPCTHGGCNWMTHSPTNGTRSNGDLVRVGGEHRNGNYCIDNWKIVRGKLPY